MTPDGLRTAAETLEAERRWFARASNGIAAGAAALGGLRGLQTLLEAPRSPGAVVGACSEVLLYGLLGLAGAAVVRALGVWLSTRAFPVDVPAPATEGPDQPRPAAPEAVRPDSAPRLAEIRRLIRDQDWEGATDALQAFRDEHPDDPRGARAAADLERAVEAAIARLEAELRAAREINDPRQALDVHARLRGLLDPDRRGSLDVELARWLLSAVHRRLRAGRIEADVVTLADRIAEEFGHTADGASLRASLPTLRRSAGLCPRCGKPYTGLAPACPECQKAAAASTPTPATEVEPAPDDVQEPPVQPREDDLFTEPDE